MVCPDDRPTQTLNTHPESMSAGYTNILIEKYNIYIKYSSPI